MWYCACLCCVDIASPVFQPPCCHQASCVQWRPLSSLSDRHTGSQSPQSVPSRPPWTQHLRNPENEVRSNQNVKIPNISCIRRHCKSCCVIFLPLRQVLTLWERVVVLSRGCRAVLGVHSHHGDLWGVSNTQDRNLHYCHISFYLGFTYTILDLRETDDGL